MGRFHICSGLKSFYGPLEKHLLLFSLFTFPDKSKEVCRLVSSSLGYFLFFPVVTQMLLQECVGCCVLVFCFSLWQNQTSFCKLFFSSLTDKFCPEEKIENENRWVIWTSLKNKKKIWGYLIALIPVSKQPSSTESIRYPRPQGFGTDPREGHKHACIHTQTLLSHPLTVNPLIKGGNWSGGRANRVCCVTTECLCDVRLSSQSPHRSDFLQ